MCSYCGQSPNTRDHVPSKVLLEEPFPENLPVVPCCDKCNQSFSLDEAYFACLLECVIHGTTNIKQLTCPKVKRILSKRKSLRSQLEKSMSEVDGEISFRAELSSIKNVLLKLAKGHVKYENSDPLLIEPNHVAIVPIDLMTDREYEEFMSPVELQKFPEVGSRASYNLVLNQNNQVLSSWKTVQENRYRYTVMTSVDTISVRIIVREYLAAEVVWKY